ncbi:ABC transporter substrate-binding protein [Ornithinibacillus sp. 4-3]|uniref:ABC transporter substrate-binding protein n=1 Tax=Ornithinibacillus sp. 4-3 TaxID=3231488 RepID=A0AB39HVG2_9BACI
MRKLTVIFLVFTFVFLLAACGDDTDSGSENNGNQVESTELKIGINAQPTTLDIHKTANILTRNIVKNIYETLITFDEDYEIVPMLAESVDESDDGKTYTFNLRQGVLFHNGDEMKAEDVIASMERWLESTPPAQTVLGDANFTAADDYTVVLELEESSALALPVIARTSQQFAGIMPKEVIDSADSTGVTEYIGTGPYQFEDWKESQYVKLTKFEDYQVLETGHPVVQKDAKINDVYFYIASDAATLLTGVQTGEYDLVLDIHTEHYEQLKNDSNLEVDVELYGENGLYFNKHEGLFTDQKMRQAVNTALNLDDLMQAAYGNKDLYELDSSYASEHQQGWYSEAGSEFYNQNDKEKAAQLLEEAGYDGEPIRIISSRDYEYVYNSGVVVMNELEKIGANVELEVYDWATLMSKRDEKDAWHIFIAGGPFQSIPIEMNVFSPSYFDGPLDDTIYGLVDDIIHADTTEAAQEIWDELQGYTWEYLPFIKLGNFSKLNVISKDVKGYSRFEGPILWDLTIEK